MADESDDAEDAAGLSALLNRKGKVSSSGDVLYGWPHLCQFLGLAYYTFTRVCIAIPKRPASPSEWALKVDSQLTQFTTTLVMVRGTRPTYCGTLADYQTWFHD